MKTISCSTNSKWTTMNRLAPIILCSLVFGITSCSIKENTVNEFEEKFDVLGSELRLASFKNVILLPGEGCLGCISKTEKFVKTVSDSDDILVIFTNVKSVKILKLKLGLDLGEDFFYLDKQNLFNSGRLYSMYPTVFFVKEGKIQGFEYISPNTNFQLEDIKRN